MTPIRIGELQVDRVVEDERPYAALDFLLPKASTAMIEPHADWLRPRCLSADNKVHMCFQSFIVRTGRHTILIDACTGNDKERPARPDWHRQNKPFLQTMAATGVTPEQIDLVLCTHLHADHVGWNTRLVDGRWVPTFPNAKYLFAKREYEYWERAHREGLARGEAVNHGSFGDSVLPVVDAGRAVFVESDHEIASGLHLEAAYGHTPGTCVLHARSNGQHGVFLGDVLHTPVQLIDPTLLSTPFCADPVESGRTRRALCERYADTDTILLPAHFPSPSAYRIDSHRGAFRLRD